MARLCNWVTETPTYQACGEFAEPGTYRCARHPKDPKLTRPGNLTTNQKAAIRARDNYQCASCGEHAMQVDHIRELSTFRDDQAWEANLASNLQLLCDKHHTEKTNEFRRGENAVKNDDMFDRSISARARKKRRMREQGFGV